MSTPQTPWTVRTGRVRWRRLSQVQWQRVRAAAPTLSMAIMHTVWHLCCILVWPTFLAPISGVRPPRWPHAPHRPRPWQRLHPLVWWVIHRVRPTSLRHRMLHQAWDKFRPPDPWLQQAAVARWLGVGLVGTHGAAATYLMPMAAHLLPCVHSRSASMAAMFITTITCALLLMRWLCRSMQPALFQRHRLRLATKPCFPRIYIRPRTRKRLLAHTPVDVPPSLVLVVATFMLAEPLAHALLHLCSHPAVLGFIIATTLSFHAAFTVALPSPACSHGREPPGPTVHMPAPLYRT